MADDAVLLDGDIATNAGVVDGDSVTVDPAELRPLSSVALRFEAAGAPDPGSLRDSLVDMALSDGDVLTLATPAGGTLRAEVAACRPANAGLVGDAARCVVAETPDPDDERRWGVRAHVAEAMQSVAGPLLRPEAAARLGLVQPRGWLLSGASGSGRIRMARSLAARAGARFLSLPATEIGDAPFGDGGAMLRTVFDAAIAHAPAILLIEEIDALATSGRRRRAAAAELITLIDGLAPDARVVVLATTSDPARLDPALRRPGRFQREIVLAPPGRRHRRDILVAGLCDTQCDPDLDLEALTDATDGFTAGEIMQLLRDAALAAFDRVCCAEYAEARSAVDDIVLTQADVDQALSDIRPHSVAGGAEPAAMPWADLRGLDVAKAALDRAVLRPRRTPELGRRLGARPARGILLVGPPGCGKTLLINALSKEAGLRRVTVTPADFLALDATDAAQMIADRFDAARQDAGTLLVFDAIDSLAPRHPECIRYLVDGIDRLEDGGVVAVTAHSVEGLDPALLRSGRIDVTVACPMPDSAARAAILAHHLAGRPLARGRSAGGRRRYRGHVWRGSRFTRRRRSPERAVPRGVRQRASRRCAPHARRYRRRDPGVAGYAGAA
nr:AAA family ATPase [Roseivivax jejudonensis]